MHRSTSTQRERYYKDLSYLLLRDNTRNVAVVHAYTRKGGLERTVQKKGKKGQTRAKKEKKKRKEKKEKRNKKLHTYAQGAGRVPRGQGCCLLAQSVP